MNIRSKFSRSVLHVGVCLLALCLLLTATLGCSRSKADVREVLAAMCDSQPTLPAGQIYLSTAAPDEDTYADEELLAVLFGDGALPIELSSVNAYALRLSSFATPCELAVFLCISPQDARAVAEMCLRRTETVRRATKNTASAVESTVSVCGKYVLLAIAQDPLTAVESGRRAIREK